MQSGSLQHNRERDRIAQHWSRLMPFICNGCGEQFHFPEVASTDTENRYRSLLTADVVALDQNNNIIGTAEVIRSHEPTAKVLKAQHEMMEFALYRILPRGNRKAQWMCSPQCWESYQQLEQEEPPQETEQWYNPPCSSCAHYTDANRVSTHQLQQKDGDPHSIHCIQCVARYGTAIEWQLPDGQESWEQEPNDPADVLIAYCNAMVRAEIWQEKTTKQGNHSTSTPSQTTASDGLSKATTHLGQNQPTQAAQTLERIIEIEEQSEGYPTYKPNTCIAIADTWLHIASTYRKALPNQISKLIPINNAV